MKKRGSQQWLSRFSIWRFIIGVRGLYDTMRHHGVCNLLEAVAMQISGGYFIGCEKGEVVMHDWKKLNRYPDPWQRTHSKRWWQCYEEAVHRLSINPVVRKMMSGK